MSNLAAGRGQEYGHGAVMLRVGAAMRYRRARMIHFAAAAVQSRTPASQTTVVRIDRQSPLRRWHLSS